MPREQLLGLAHDVGRLLSAGSSATAGHDGLARRARTLRELGAKVPTLAAVADAVERVTAAPPKQAGPAFLDLVVLARQIRGGLSASGADGAMEAVPPSGPWRTPGAARDVCPAYEALTGSGSGRCEALQDAAQRNAAGDLRLVPALLGALEGGNQELADLIAEQALPAAGRAVLPDLTERLDLKGKAADARRLKAVCKIDPKLGADLCRRALDGGSVPVRVAALTCLPVVGRPGEAEQAGLPLLRDKNIDLRGAALRALCHATGDEALEALVEALVGDGWMPWATRDLLAKVPHPKATARLAREIQTRVADLTPPASKKGGKRLTAANREERERQISVITLCVETMAARKDDPQAALRALLPLTRHEEPELRVAALHGLGAVGALTPEVRRAFEAELATPKGEVAAAAVDGLALLPPERREPFVPRLLALLADPNLDEDVAHPAILLLPAHRGRYGKTILERLLVQLRRKEWWPRDAVLDAVKDLGTAAAPLLPDLLQSMRDTKDHNWEDVFAAVEPEGTAAVPALVAALKDRSARARVDALEGLSGYKERARAAEAAVEKLLQDRDRHVRQWAEIALKAIRGES